MYVHPKRAGVIWHCEWSSCAELQIVFELVSIRNKVLMSLEHNPGNSEVVLKLRE